MSGRPSSNSWVAKQIKEFLDLLPVGFEYVVIGSAALMSYTQKIGYEREIHDIDIVCQSAGFEQIANRFLSLGHEPGTFIDKKMPFYKTLMRLSGSKYYRFVRNGRAMEIMTSELRHDNGQVGVELYPGFIIWIPESFSATASLDGISFKAVTPEALYCIYSVGFNTWGRIVKVKNTQVVEDLKNLKKVMDKTKLKEISKQIRVDVGWLSFKLPLMLIS